MAKWGKLGKNSIQIATIIPFEDPQCSRIILFGQPVFDPFLTCILVTNWPIFKALRGLGGAQIAQIRLQMGSFHLFVHPKWSPITYGKARL